MTPDHEFETIISDSFTHTNEEPNQGHIFCQKPGEQAGKWFIEGLNLTEIYTIELVFYSNSFSYTDGTNRYYLFEDLPEVVPVYNHTLKFVDKIVIPSETKVKGEVKLNLDLDSHSSINSGILYKIEVDMYVIGQTWENPTGSVVNDGI